MSPKKLYLLASGMEILPSPNGTTDVGRLYANPHDLTIPLSWDYYKPADANIESLPKTDYALSISKTKTVRAGIFASWVSLAGVGGELGGGIISSQEGDYNFKTLTTRSVQATPGFIEAAINHADVRAFLEAKNAPKTIYMLRSLMVAEGATFREKHTKGGKWNAHLGVTDGQVNVGFKAQGASGSLSSQSFGSQSFVFAYSMLELRCRVKDDGTMGAREPSHVAGNFG